MPQVRKVLEAVIWLLDTNLDFKPIGSEQPEVFEHTVEVRPGRETEEETEWKERGRKYDRQRTDMKRPRPASDE